jgi:hypothetical protein
MPTLVSPATHPPPRPRRASLPAHTPIVRPNAALTAPEIQRLFQGALQVPLTPACNLSHSRRMHFIEEFAEGVRRPARGREVGAASGFASPKPSHVAPLSCPLRNGWTSARAPSTPIIDKCTSRYSTWYRPVQGLYVGFACGRQSRPSTSRSCYPRAVHGVWRIGTSSAWLSCMGEY